MKTKTTHTPGQIRMVHDLAVEFRHLNRGLALPALYAAAPDLLASLHEFVYGEARTVEAIEAMLARGRAALAKAGHP